MIKFFEFLVSVAMLGNSTFNRNSMFKFAKSALFQKWHGSDCEQAHPQTSDKSVPSNRDMYDNQKVKQNRSCVVNMETR